MNSSRYPWIDYLKALGIILVVAGHTALSDGTHRWIYAFHMPLFFMVSGFLISPKALEVPLKEFFQRRVWKLIKLYLIFALLGAAFYAYQFRHEQALGELITGRLRSIAYASSSFNNSSDLYPLVLWFFPALMVGLLLLWVGWKVKPWWGKALVLTGVTALGFSLGGRALPWEFESGCLAAGFLALGQAGRAAKWDEGLAKVGHGIWIPAVAALLTGSAMAVMNHDSLDVRLAHLGHPLLSFFGCVLLVFGFTTLTFRLPALRVIESISAATILIFPLHTLMFPYVDRVAVKLFPEFHGEAYGWAKALLVTAALTIVHFCYGKFMHKRREAAR